MRNCFQIPGLCRTSKASMRVSRPGSGYDSESEAVTESDDDEGVTGRLSDAAVAAAYRTNPNLPD